MKSASGIFLILAAVFLVSCSRSHEAKARNDQEVEFSGIFGFSPPPTITTINYSDLYNRGVMDGSAVQWLSFTFEQSSFDKIIQGGYTNEKSANIPNGGATPSWWPKTIPEDTVIYSRSQNDTPEEEGFSFQEYIWHDDASGLVFFCKSYWD